MRLLVGVLSSVVEEKCLVNQSLSGAQLVLERDPTIVLTLPHHHQPPGWLQLPIQQGRIKSTGQCQVLFKLDDTTANKAYSTMASTAVVVQGQCKGWFESCLPESAPPSDNAQSALL